MKSGTFSKKIYAYRTFLLALSLFLPLTRASSASDLGCIASHAHIKVQKLVEQLKPMLRSLNPRDRIEGFSLLFFLRTFEQEPLVDSFPKLFKQTFGKGITEIQTKQPPNARSLLQNFSQAFNQVLSPVSLRSFLEDHAGIVDEDFNLKIVDGKPMNTADARSMFESALLKLIQGRRRPEIANIRKYLSKNLPSSVLGMAMVQEVFRELENGSLIIALADFTSTFKETEPERRPHAAYDFMEKKVLLDKHSVLYLHPIIIMGDIVHEAAHSRQDLQKTYKIPETATRTPKDLVSKIRELLMQDELAAVTAAYKKVSIQS